MQQQSSCNRNQQSCCFRRQYWLTTEKSKGYGSIWPEELLFLISVNDPYANPSLSAQNPPSTKHKGEGRVGLLRILRRNYEGFIVFSTVFLSCPRESPHLLPPHLSSLFMSRRKGWCKYAETHDSILISALRRKNNASSRLPLQWNRAFSLSFRTARSVKTAPSQKKKKIRYREYICKK